MPLLVVPDSFVYPFVFPKVVVQRVLIAMLVAVAGMLVAAQPGRYRLRPSLLTAAVLLFAGIALLSSFTGVDVHHSLWSGFERMLGTVTLLYYAAFFMALRVVVRSRGEWDGLLDVALAVAAVCAVVGLGQKIDPDWLYNAGRTRVISTLGHPTYLAGLSLFGVVLGASRALETKGARRVLAIGSVVLGLAGIMISETRGTLLGLVAAGVVWIFCTFWDRRDVRRSLMFAAALFVLVGTVAVMLLLRDAEVLDSIPLVRRFSDLSFAHSRLLTWDVALSAFADRPILGWGPGNFAYAYYQYLDPALLSIEPRRFDDAHNLLLNVMATQGLLGAAALLGLFGVGGFTLLRQPDVKLRRVGLAYLAAHFVHDSFVFESPTSYLCFFFFLAWVDGRTDCARLANDEGERVSGSLVLALASLAIAVASVALVDGPAWRANRAARRAFQSLSQCAADAEIRVDAALSSGSAHRVDVVQLLAPAMAVALPKCQTRWGAIASATLTSRIYNEASRAAERHPLEIQHELRRARLATAYARSVGDGRWLREARLGLSRARALAPSHPAIAYEMAALAMLSGDAPAATRLLAQAVADAPLQAEGYTRLAAAWLEQGDARRARQILDRARDQGVELGSEGAALRESVDPKPPFRGP